MPLALGTALLLNRRFRGVALPGRRGAAAVGRRAGRHRPLLEVHLPQPVRARDRGHECARARRRPGPVAGRLGHRHGRGRRRRRRGARCRCSRCCCSPRSRRSRRRSTGRRGWTARPAWQSFRYVTLPGIRNTLLVVAILHVILSLQVFDVLFTLTGGGPGRPRRSSATTSTDHVELPELRLLGGAGGLPVRVIVLCSSLLLAARLREPRTGRRTDERHGLTLSTDRIRIRRPQAARLLALRAPQRRSTSPSARAGDAARAGSARLAFGDRRRRAARSGCSGRSSGSRSRSLQPEGAVTTLPPRAHARAPLRQLHALLADPTWIGSIVRACVVTIAVTVHRDRRRRAGRVPAGALDLPGKRRDHGGPDLHADGPGDRARDPGAAAVPAPRR